MKTRLYRLLPNRQHLLATFEAEGEAERVAILYASFDREDYLLDFGRGKEKTVRSYKWIACPKCDSHYRYADVAHRQMYSHFECDCGERLVIDWAFPNAKAERYID